MTSKNYGLTGLGNNVELGKEGLRIRDDSGGVEFRNNIDDAYVPVRAGAAVGDDDVITKKYLETHSGLAVTGQIDGGSPPAAGTPGRVFIVTTAGGSYDLKDLYRDNGVSWEEITITEGMRVTVTDDLTGGTDEYLGDHIYLWDADSSTWLDVGPSPALSKAIRTERLTLDSTKIGNNNFGSALPVDAIVTKIKVNVTQAFAGTSPDLKVGDGTDDDRHMTTAEVNLKKVGLYVVENLYLYGSGGQVIANLAIGGTPGAGQALCLLEYSVA